MKIALFAVSTIKGQPFSAISLSIQNIVVENLIAFLCQITVEAIKSQCDEVSLQGIEFWSTVCDEEMDLAIEAAEVYTGLKIIARH